LVDKTNNDDNPTTTTATTTTTTTTITTTTLYGMFVVDRRTSRIQISRLPMGTTQDDLVPLVASYGPVQQCVISE